MVNTKISTPLLHVWELGNRKEEEEGECNEMTSVTKLVLIRAVKTIRSMVKVELNYWLDRLNRYATHVTHFLYKKVSNKRRSLFSLF